MGKKKRKSLDRAIGDYLTATYGLDEADLAKFRLICRYWDKVSRRLQDAHGLLLKKARTGKYGAVSKLLEGPNLLLNEVKQDE